MPECRQKQGKIEEKMRQTQHGHFMKSLRRCPFETWTKSLDKLRGHGTEHATKRNLAT